MVCARRLIRSEAGPGWADRVFWARFTATVCQAVYGLP